MTTMKEIPVEVESVNGSAVAVAVIVLANITVFWGLIVYLVCR